MHTRQTTAKLLEERTQLR